MMRVRPGLAGAGTIVRCGLPRRGCSLRRLVPPRQDDGGGEEEAGKVANELASGEINVLLWMFWAIECNGSARPRGRTTTTTGARNWLLCRYARLTPSSCSISLFVSQQATVTIQRRAHTGARPPAAHPRFYGKRRPPHLVASASSTATAQRQTHTRRGKPTPSPPPPIEAPSPSPI